MSERVAPDLMIHEELVTLRGYERVFNKVSWLRGCDASDAVLDVPDVPDRFRTTDRHLSLVLGLRVNPSASVVGYLQVYPSDVAAEVVGQLDRREGYDPARPTNESAYLRRSCRIEDSDGKTKEAVTYFTNSSCDMVDEDLSLETQASILAAATPAEVIGPKAKGLFYLEGVRSALSTHGLHDQNLEALSRCAYKWYLGRLKFLPPLP